MNHLITWSTVILILLNVSVQCSVILEASVLKGVEEVSSFGTDRFYWSYKSFDGREVQQSGQKKILEDGRAVLVISGVYRFFGPDGVKYTVIYSADEYGYRENMIVGDPTAIPSGGAGAYSGARSAGFTVRSGAFMSSIRCDLYRSLISVRNLDKQVLEVCT